MSEYLALTAKSIIDRNYCKGFACLAGNNEHLREKQLLVIGPTCCKGLHAFMAEFMSTKLKLTSTLAHDVADVILSFADSPLSKY